MNAHDTDYPNTDTRLNVRIAGRLREMADLLEQQAANPFRTQAYRRAADTVERLDENIAELVEGEGRQGLLALDGVGKSIAAAIAEMVHTGRWSQLDRMRGALDPEKLFQTIPGVGPELARRLHDNLHVDTLEGLETAVFEGRAADVPGVGAARLRMLKAALSDMLQRTRRHRSVPPLEPSVALILDVDREYRQRAAAGALRRIAPRRFNPEGKAWLPILHTERKDWHFTVLFSNTARAHQYDKLHDWVVVYFHTPHEAEGQRTVVTETRGVLAGKRVVRGREKACRNYYGG